MTPAGINRHRSSAFGIVLLTFLACGVVLNSASATTIDDKHVTSLPVTTPIPTTPTPSTTVLLTVPTTVQTTLRTTISAPASAEPPKDNNTSIKVSGSHANNKLVPVSNISGVLDLSQTNIVSMSDVLQDLRTIPVRLLNLSANHLHIIPGLTSFNLTGLRCLDLADNNISQIKAHAFASLTTLQHLNLSRNSLTALEDDTFKGLTSLQQLDLSLNDLTRIAPGALELSSLTRLVLAGNQHLGANVDSPLFIATGRRLQTMDATRVALPQIPSALTHSIRTLHLSENRIQIVRRGEMDSYPLLQLLDLSWNNLMDIEDDALGRLEMLTILYLTNNHLSEIPHSLPERLKVLHLERNRITTLTPEDLEGLNQLEVLLLSGNQIGKISDGAFVQVPNLVTLDLSRNTLLKLPAGSLTGPSKLRVLRLSQLNISMSTVKEATFPLPETEFLITLDLSGSPAVARQWLEDPAALAAARELQELDLSNCGIRTLPMDTLHYLPQLRSLHLRDNSLNCTGLEWLAEWMRLQEAAEHRMVYCASPGDLWGTLLVDLQSLQTNIDEKPTRKTPTTPNPPARRKHVDIFNPFAMHILQPSAPPPRQAEATPVGISQVDARKKLNRIMADANDVRDATIKSIIWPEAIKSDTRRNLFMKNSSIAKLTADGTTQPAHTEDLTALSLTEAHPHHPNNHTSGLQTQASKYSSSSPADTHPGMYLLIVGIMGAALILITLTSRMARRTREDLQILRAFPHDQQHDGELIEVSSLPSVTELW